MSLRIVLKMLHLYEMKIHSKVLYFNVYAIQRSFDILLNCKTSKKISIARCLSIIDVQFWLNDSKKRRLQHWSTYTSLSIFSMTLENKRIQEFLHRIFFNTSKSQTWHQHIINCAWSKIILIDNFVNKYFNSKNQRRFNSF